MDIDKWSELIKLSAQYQNQDFWKGFAGQENSDLNKKHSFSGQEQEMLSAFLSKHDVFPRCDMYEADGRLLIDAELPGMRQEDIKVYLHQSELVIKGECSTFKHSFRYFLKERPSRTFEKKLTLPLPIDKNRISTSFTNGILSIILPIKEDEDEKVPIFVNDFRP